MKMKLGDLGVELNPAQVKKAADAVTKVLPHTVGRLRRLCEDKVMKPIGKSISELEKQSASANLKRDFKEAAKPNAPVPEQTKYAAKLPDPASMKKRDAPAPVQKLPQPGLDSRQMQNQMAMDAAAKQNAASTSKAATPTPQVKPEFNKAVKGPSRGRSI